MSLAKIGRILSATLILCLGTACAGNAMDEGILSVQQDSASQTGIDFGGVEHFVRDDTGVYLCVLRRPTDLADLRSRFTSGPSQAGATSEIDSGAEVFSQTCQACHGPTASGVDGLGPALVDNLFVASLTDGELSEFVTKGRSVADPANHSGLPMPPNGGNPNLSESDIADIVAYLRSLEA